MAHGKKTELETPVEKKLFKPDGAENLPTKTYPGSSKLGPSKGKGTGIEGPCDDCSKGYHK